MRLTFLESLSPIQLTLYFKISKSVILTQFLIYCIGMYKTTTSDKGILCGKKCVYFTHFERKRFKIFFTNYKKSPYKPFFWKIIYFLCNNIEPKTKLKGNV